MRAADVRALPPLPRAFEVLNAAFGDIYTAAVLHVRQDGEVVAEAAFGELLPGGPAVATDAIFDLASLTKLFVGTATLALFDRRKFALSDPIVGVMPEFAGRDKRRSKVTLRHLLTHSSGLPAHVQFRDDVGNAAIVARVCATPLEYAPGGDAIYSDLGFIVLGEAVARLFGQRLDAAVRDLVSEPLGLPSLTYRPPAALLDRLVCTENDSWRGRLLRGEVHDENAWAMGGVAGHAGLFGTAGEVAELAEAYRLGGAVDLRRVLLRPTAARAVREHVRSAEERRGFAWALKVSDASSCGPRFSPHSFGHTGYTGTSVWVDPKRGLTVVLLTNRVFVSREPGPIHALRVAVHEAIVDDLQCA